MAGETTITLVGNITADPELRFTPSGKAVAKFTIASTARTFDKNSNEWKDSDPLFMYVSVWDQQAENVAESLTKGSRVTVVGVLRQRSYETKEGEKRTVYEVTADDVGVSLKWATAKPVKVSKGGNRAAGTVTHDDPWATSTPAGGGGGNFDDEPPF